MSDRWIVDDFASALDHTCDARNALKVYERLAAYRPSLRQLLERLKTA